MSLKKKRRKDKLGFTTVAIACCSQFLIGQGLRTLIYSWLGKKMFISMACRALFVMLPVFWVINFQLIWMNTLCIYFEHAQGRKVIPY